MRRKRKNPRTHADYVNANDFPEVWKKLFATIDVEAQAKELEVVARNGSLDILRKWFTTVSNMA